MSNDARGRDNIFFFRYVFPTAVNVPDGCNTVIVSDLMTGETQTYEDLSFPYLRADLIAAAIERGETDGFK